MRPPRDYRPGVGILLLNAAGLAFVGHRLDADAWQLPQGGIDHGEDPKTAALRELREETGVQAPQVLGVTPGWLQYDLPPDIAFRVWGGRYRGQRQRWFAMRHTETDQEIDVRPGGEFDAWKWVSPTLLPDLAVSFKTALYRDVLKAFAPLLKGP